MEQEVLNLPYASYIPRLEKWETITWTESFDLFMQQYKNTWKSRNIENAEAFVHRLDAFLLTKNLPFVKLIPLKNAIAMYNLQTNFADFEGAEQIRSMVAGFGSGGGTKLPYKKSEDGMQCWRSNYVSGGACPYWDKCENEWFAMHFCTEDQWAFIAELGR